MKAYLNLLHDILTYGDVVYQRAKLISDGRKPKCISSISSQLFLELGKNGEDFPLMTTKFVSWKAVAHELIWFLRGDTNIKYLKDNKVPIWDAWADENGDLGSIYGKHWRRWPCIKDGIQRKSIDQIANLESSIRRVVSDPESPLARRMVLLNLNPGDMPDPKVPTGCHTLSQYLVRGNELNKTLHCHVYMRSCDAFLGLPYNIACYAMLTSILAFRAGIEPGSLRFSFGDVHIYENHIPQVREQLDRLHRPRPKLVIDQRVKDLNHLEELAIDMLSVEGYLPYGKLPGEVAV